MSRRAISTPCKSTRKPAKMTALFHVMGPLIYLDEKGEAVDYDDVFLRLDRYTKHCREVGLGGDYVKSLIR